MSNFHTMQSLNHVLTNEYISKSTQNDHFYGNNQAQNVHLRSTEKASIETECF